MDGVPQRAHATGSRTLAARGSRRLTLVAPTAPVVVADPQHQNGQDAIQALGTCLAGDPTAGRCPCAAMTTPGRSSIGQPDRRARSAPEPRGPQVTFPLRPRRRRSAGARSRPGRRSARRASRPWRSCSRRRRRRRPACRCWPTPMRRSLAPARSHRRWKAGRGDLLAAARVGDRPGDHEGLAGQRRVGGDLRREVLVADVEVDAQLAQPRELGARAVAVEVRAQAGGDLRADVLDLLQRLLVGVGDLLEAAIAGAAQPRGGRLGGHRDGQADQRAAQADRRGCGRSTRASGRPTPRRCRSKPSRSSRLRA